MTVALDVQVYDSQSNHGFEATFERFPVRLGRNQLNDLYIDRPYISQFHAAIEIKGQQIIFKDLGSTNGTIYQGKKLVRDEPVDITGFPELKIGPITIRTSIKEVKARAPASHQTSVLDIGTPAGQALDQERKQSIAPGQEDPFIRQLVPYIEAFRSAWSHVYRLVYEHLTRLQPDIRERYLKRLLLEHPGIAHEPEFQTVAQYYGVPTHSVGELSNAHAALAGLNELFRSLAPEQPPLNTPHELVGFARRLRDTMAVFMKCFVSLRDGYQEFEVEVLRKEQFEEVGNKVGAAKDHSALGQVLFAHDANTEETSHQLHEVFVEVMTHQVAMLNGVMEGVKQLLDTLSPEQIEKGYEQKGKKGGLFSNKYEGLWQEYQTIHGDYQGEDKETFLIIFGPQFSRAYAATTGEAYQAAPDITGRHLSRAGTNTNQSRR